ncbi:MAG: EscU/YscU/HrcU family type III secretion system export apparatus switch protein, partial [Nisaea sp.]|uniref:EscU/YscU/HrcU family type III secretion system export apparatus switch protein n=1 Tax=Nisaea sp. TaxID=2024842 RepID=UPI003266DE38
MAEEDDSQKTEEPTGRKLSKARDEGQVAQSQEIKSLMILIGGVGMLMFMAPAMARDITLIGRRFIGAAYSIPMDFEHLRLVFSKVAMEVGVILAPAMAMFVVLAIVANVGQFGLI